MITPAQSNSINQTVKELWSTLMVQSMLDAGKKESTMDQEILMLIMEHQK